MKKLFLLASLFSCGCLFSQTKKDEKALKAEIRPTRPLSPHISAKLDTTKVLNLQKEDSNSRFYKNLTDEKASQYKMLRKITPSENYQSERITPLKMDTLQKQKKIKPLEK